MDRIVVDLPAPLGPRNPVTTPGRTVNVTWSTAVTAFSPEPYFLVSSRTSIMPSSVPGAAAGRIVHAQASGIPRM